MISENDKRTPHPTCVAFVHVVMVAGTVWMLWNIMQAIGESLKQRGFPVDAQTMAWSLVGIAAAVVCTILSILVIPGVTVLLETIKVARNNRDQFVALLDEFDEKIQEFLDSKTGDEQSQIRMGIDRIEQDLGEVSRALAPYIPRNLLLDINTLRYVWVISCLSDISSVPARFESQVEIQETFGDLKRQSSDLRNRIQDADRNDEFARIVKRQIREIYCSIWVFIVHSIRR